MFRACSPRKQGAHIVTTTSTSGILPGSGAGIYTVAKIAAVGLMEELRHELRNTNIGTSAFIPGLTTTNIGQSESYRPESLKNDGPPAVAPGAQPRPAPARAHRGSSAGVPPSARSPILTRPQDPVVVARLLLDGILNNDLFIVAPARVPRGRRGAMQRAAGIDGGVQAAATRAAARERLPHADLPAGNRASQGDAGAGHPGDLRARLIGSHFPFSRTSCRSSSPRCHLRITTGTYPIAENESVLPASAPGSGPGPRRRAAIAACCRCDRRPFRLRRAVARLAARRVARPDFHADLRPQPDRHAGDR